MMTVSISIVCVINVPFLKRQMYISTSPFVLRGEELKSKVKDLTNVHVIPTHNEM